MLLNKYFFLIIIFLSFVLLLSNLLSPELKGEEPLRLLVSFEMFKNQNFFEPTLFGEPYFNKPPLYNWMQILSSFFVGWNEATGRILSVLFTGLTTFFVFSFSKFLFGEKRLAILSAIVYLTFLDVLFYYGWIGEIDAVFTFFVFIMMISQYIGFIKNKSEFIILSGFLSGLIFLFKGFNAYAFYGFTFLALSMFKKSFFNLFKPVYLLSYSIAVLVPISWLVFIPDNYRFLQTLFSEVSNRVEYNFNFLKSLTHFFSYLLLNIKQTLTASIFVIFLIILKRKDIILDISVKILSLIILLNYIPYILMASGNDTYTIHGRYIMPLFPLLAVIFGYILHKSSSKKVLNLFLISIVFILFLKIAYNFLLHNLSEPKLRKQIAQKILKDTNFSKNIAFDKSCILHKAIVFYIESKNDCVIKTPKINTNWDYLISCRNENFSLYKTYMLKDENIFLYKK